MAHQAGSYPGFCCIKRLGILLLPLDRSIKFADTHLYTWVERGIVRVRVSCPRTLHNVPGRTARSGVELAIHEATAPPTIEHDILYINKDYLQRTS